MSYSTKHDVDKVLWSMLTERSRFVDRYTPPQHRVNRFVRWRRRTEYCFWDWLHRLSVKHGATCDWD